MFTDGYNMFSEFLTNEEILEILDICGVNNDPRMRLLGEVLLRILKACRDRSEKDLKVREPELVLKR